MPRPSDKTTSLGLSACAIKDLYPETFSGEERLNALGGLLLTGYSHTAQKLDKAVAGHVTATLRRDAKTRLEDDLCVEIVQLPGDATAERYSVLLRPCLWWLSLASNHQVFQYKTVPEIIKAVFSGHSFSDYQLKLDATYAKGRRLG